MHEHFNKVYVHLKGLEIEMCILWMLRSQCDSLKIFKSRVFLTRWHFEDDCVEYIFLT